MGTLLTLAFALGFVVAERQMPDYARMTGRPGAGRTTVRLRPAKERDWASRTIEADFYQALLENRAKGRKPLSPIPLPDVTARRAKGSGGEEGKRKPAQAPAALPSGGGGGGSYTVQVLSVREAAGAERAARALRRKGFAAFVERVDLRERGVWHRVRVGRYADRAAAARALDALRAKTALRGGRVAPL
ncbi:MAG: SPOR domain-containing protein [bacterium]